MLRGVPERGGLTRAKAAARLALCILCLALLQCVFETREAGTSTSVTNPTIAAEVGGYIIAADGGPAVGALVIVRYPLPLIDSAGVPHSKEAARAAADSTGRFVVPMFYHQDVYMEIRMPGAGPIDSQQVELRRWPIGLPVGGEIGTLRMLPPGMLTARIRTPQFLSGATRWVGVRGTDRFIAAPDTNPFLIHGVPAGQVELQVVEVPNPPKPDTIGPPLWDTVSVGEVKSGQVSDLGSIFYNND